MSPMRGTMGFTFCAFLLLPPSRSSSISPRLSAWLKDGRYSLLYVLDFSAHRSLRTMAAAITSVSPPMLRRAAAAAALSASISASLERPRWSCALRLATAISISVPLFLSCSTSRLVSATSASSFLMELTTASPASSSWQPSSPSSPYAERGDVNDGEECAEYIGTIAAVASGSSSASTSAIAFGERVVVLLLLLSSCLALGVALACASAMATALLLYLELLPPTRMRSPNTATASFTDRKGRAVSTSTRSEAMDVLLPQGSGLQETSTNSRGFIWRGVAAGFFASTSTAHWPPAASLKQPVSQ
uniref:Uncharacterized protein n=1 Tax=Triticum urartu TaxID=4572 RepID=A0A8R7U4N6_TRIUA